MKAVKKIIAVLALLAVIMGCPSPLSKVDRIITFDANGGRGTMAQAAVPDGEDFTVPANKFTRAGYSFLRWDTQSDGTGKSYDNGDGIANVGGDITLYAIWGANRTISFDANGGSGSMGPAIVGDGGTYTVPAPDVSFALDGYSFLRWNTSADGSGTSYNPGASISVVSNLTLYAIWGANRTISFNANGGSGTMSAGTVGNGGTYTVPACEFTRAGYGFLRWNTAADGLSGTNYVPGNGIANVTSDITLYAIWGANLTISFNANGGSGTMTAATVGDGGTYTIPANAFTRAGYNFVRWNTASDGTGTSYDPGTSMTVTADVTLYAIWTADRIIAFNANGGSGSMATATVANGNGYTIPVNAFTRSGYAFVRWDTAAAGNGTAWYPGDYIASVTSNITLYAVWIAQRTIAFSANGGSGSMTSATVNNGASYTVPANAFTRAGYSFLRWNTTAAGNGTNYSAGDSITVTANVTLYAIWGANRTISFNANGGSGTMTAATVGDGGTYTIPANAFTWAGYGFLRWNTAAAGNGTSYNPGDSVTVTANIALYAIWGANRTISFNANGGSGTMTAATVGDGGTYTIPANAFTRAGYGFLRWNTASDGSGTSYNPGDSVTVTANIALYAIWGANRTISFNANGGSGTMTAATVGDGGTYTIPANTFTRAGYNFVRWNTASDDSGTGYNPGGSMTVTANVMLYAIWTADRTVTFDANGGTGSMATATVANGNGYTIPVNAFTRAGYTFVRWDTAAAGNGTAYDPGDYIASVTSNITLYAVWIAQRTISFNANLGTGTMTPATVNNGSSYTVPLNAFTRAGYSFLQWNTAAAGNGTAYYPGNSMTVTANLTLYAIWGANRTISFDANGGSGTMTAATVVDGFGYTVPVNAFTRSGYGFVRWDTAAAGNGIAWYPGDYIASVTSNITLYAVWIAQRTISFNANGGTGTMAAATVNDGASYTVPASAFTRAGYGFLRWNTAANGSGTSYYSGDSIASVTSNVTLYAIWLAQRTISFNANGGTGSMAAATVPDGSDYNIASNQFVRLGYLFSHWNTLAGDTGTSYDNGDTIVNVSSNIVLYAIWTAVNRTIAFNANLGTGTMASDTVLDGHDYVIPANGFARQGYSFLRWDTAAAGNGTPYAANGVIYGVTANMTLYAIWSQLPNVIRLIDFDSGLTLSQIFTTVADPSGTLSIQNTIARSGYALRKNLADVHRLDVSFDGTAGYQDFWVMFDFYLESNYTFRPETHTPLLMLIDSSTDTVPGTTIPKLIGVPLFNYFTAETPIIGYNSFRCLTNILPATIQNKIIYRTPIDTGLAGKWVNIKLHIKMDGTLAGMDMYIDKVRLANPRIAEGDMPESIHFDLLRIWYQVDADTHLVQSSPGTNIYLDNIGLYRADPDL